jgi:hypothetical protein
MKDKISVALDDSPDEYEDYYIERESHGLYLIRSTSSGGVLPDVMAGKFTNRHTATKTIDKYLRARGPVKLKLSRFFTDLPDVPQKRKLHAKVKENPFPDKVQARREEI